MILPPFPTSGIVNWQVFVPSQGVGAVFQPWLKPPGVSLIYIIAVSGGAGGGGGQSTAAAARTGGGGGGSGALQRIIIPAFMAPDILHSRPGFGAPGGAAAGNGSNGQTTYVSVAPDPNSNAYSILQPEFSTGGTAAGGGGAAATSQLNPSLAAWGVVVGSNGQAGAAGGANTGAVGASLSIPLGHFLTGGAGGAGSSTANSVHAGGAISASTPATGPAMWRTVAGGAAGTSGSVAGFPGNAGINHAVPLLPIFSRTMPLLFSGGSGGGSGGASNGGAGAPGAWGCGGGGGGAGAVGGVGGRGGDGFVIIGAF